MYNLLHFNLKDPTKETRCANVCHIGQLMVLSASGLRHYIIIPSQYIPCGSRGGVTIITCMIISQH